MSELDFYIIISESYKQNLFYADFLNSLTLLDIDSTAAMQPVSRKRMCLNYFIFLKYIEQMCSQKIMGLVFFFYLLRASAGSQIIIIFCYMGTAGD